MIIKFITFNLGLLDYKILGKTIFSNPYYSNERIIHIPNALLKYDADIIAIQECYDDAYVNFIKNKLKLLYPYVARKDKKRNMLQLHNGLIIFSKFPIKSVNLFPYSNSDIVENYFGNKCLLVTEIIFNNQVISLFNIHLTAGSYNPESLTSTNHRLSQIKEVLLITNHYKSRNTIPIILGDFNSGKIRTNKNYYLMLNNGFIDTHDKINNNDKINFTWSPNNVQNSVHNNAQVDKIDHLFYHNSDKNIKILDSKIILYEKNIKLKNNQYCGLSDHYGLLTTIEII